MSATISCPNCRCDEVIPIVYGLPGAELLDAADRGEVKLGGCVIADGFPTLACRACGHEWEPMSLGESTDRNRNRRLPISVNVLFWAVAIGILLAILGAVGLESYWTS
jgi:hypothetical protein